jgi:hypothetical protein
MAHPSETHDLTAVRVRLEDRCLDILAQVQPLPESDYPYRRRNERRELQARALRIGPTMAPEVFQVLQTAKRRLGVDENIELYQSDSIQGNACVHYDLSPVAIELTGHWLHSVDHAALAAVLGHELGHHIAHGVGTRAYAALHKPWDPTVGGIGQVYDVFRLASEITADRFGLLACRDVEAALRLGMMAVSGLPATALNWDTTEYLKQSRSVVEDLLAAGDDVIGSTHPEHNVRAVAVWMFSETDLYKDLTRQGPGSRDVAEVDSAIDRILTSKRAFPSLIQTSAPDDPRPFPHIQQQLEAGARRAVGALGKVKSALAPGMKALLNRRKHAPPPEPDDLDDILEDPAEQDLLRRFEELEKNFRPKK